MDGIPKIYTFVCFRALLEGTRWSKLYSGGALSDNDASVYWDDSDKETSVLRGSSLPWTANSKFWEREQANLTAEMVRQREEGIRNLREVWRKTAKKSLDPTETGQTPELGVHSMSDPLGNVGSSRVGGPFSITANPESDDSGAVMAPSSEIPARNLTVVPNTLEYNSSDTGIYSLPKEEDTSVIGKPIQNVDYFASSQTNSTATASPQTSPGRTQRFPSEPDYHAPPTPYQKLNWSSETLDTVDAASNSSSQSQTTAITAFAANPRLTSQAKKGTPFMLAVNEDLSMIIIPPPPSQAPPVPPLTTLPHYADDGHMAKRPLPKIPPPPKEPPPEPPISAPGSHTNGYFGMGENSHTPTLSREHTYENVRTGESDISMAAMAPSKSSVDLVTLSSNTSTQPPNHAPPAPPAPPPPFPGTRPKASFYTPPSNPQPQTASTESSSGAQNGASHWLTADVLSRAQKSLKKTIKIKDGAKTREDPFSDHEEKLKWYKANRKNPERRKTLVDEIKVKLKQAREINHDVIKASDVADMGVAKVSADNKERSTTGKTWQMLQHEFGGKGEEHDGTSRSSNSEDDKENDSQYTEGIYIKITKIRSFLH